MNCNLCNYEINTHKTDKEERKYFICNNCELIQLGKEFYLSSEEEKQRYKLHENSTNNKGYLTYLNKIIKNSISPFTKPGDSIFDFGCGPEKTWAGILKKKGYQVTTYDPYFDYNTKWINRQFDAITGIEVFEHLGNPAKELKTLSSCLNKGSFLILRTMLHDSNWNNFQKWWYREDQTHISFYSELTIKYICKAWKYDLVQIKDQCEIVLKKK